MWNPFAKKDQASIFSKLTETILLSCICLLCIAVRVWYVSGNEIIFSFDQARDAYLARQIIQDGDIKIQGPNASGTNDSIYHGVLYYYVIALFYGMSSNPMYPTYVLIFITTLGLLPVYFLVKSVFKSQLVALTTITLTAFSINHIQAATWASNPTLALLTVPLFYLSLWKVFTQKSKRWLPWLALFLGLTIQSAVWFAYLFVILAIFILYSRYTQVFPQRFFSLKEIAVAVAIFLISTSTMFLTQLKLAAAGIFTPASLVTSLAGTNKAAAFSIETSTDVFYLFVEKMSKSFVPILPLFSILLLGFSLYSLRKFSGQQRMFWVLWLFGPFALLAVQPREAQHLFLTCEIALYAIFSYGITAFLQDKWNAKYVKLALCLVIVLIGASQLVFTTTQKKNRINDFTLQTGMFLTEELAAIDWTYQAAGYKPFSIASYTAPYGYNTLWSYLYDWYGREKYGYVPEFYGMKQDGIFAGELLPHTTKPASTHYVFIEPNVGAPDLIFQNFELEQAKVTTFSGQGFFGTLHVIQREPYYVQ